MTASFDGHAEAVGLSPRGIPAPAGSDRLIYLRATGTAMVMLLITVITSSGRQPVPWGVNLLWKSSEPGKGGEG